MARTGKTKKLFSILLAAVMALTVMPAISVNLQPKAQAAALTITTADGLKSFLSAVAGGNSLSRQTVVLGADIDLSNQNMSGVQNNANNAFQGTFDGQGHTIRNFYLSAGGAYWGLFRYTAGNAVIKNLNLTGVNVSSSDNDVSALVGYAGGGRNAGGFCRRNGPAGF